MNINKEINRILKEIILLMLLIISSNLLWSTFNYEKDASIAYAYSNINTLTLTEKINEENITLKITNTGKVMKKYKLFVKTTERLDLLELKNETINLNEIDNFKIGNTIYYLIEENTIDKKTTKKIEIKTKIKKINFKIEEI